MTSKWRGGVDAKLDTILGIKSDVEKLDCKVDDHGTQNYGGRRKRKASAKKNRIIYKRSLIE